MRKNLLSTIAGAALFLGGCGLAAAQQMGSPGPTNPGAQGSSQRQPGTAENPSEHHPGAMQGQAQGRSSATDEHRSGQTGAMQGQAQGRSSATKENGRRSGQTGTMQGEDQGRSAVGEKGRRSGHRGAMQSQAQGRSGAVEENGRRSGHHDAMQSQAQGRSGTLQGPAQERSGRSVGTTTLASGQKTRLHEVIAGGNIRRVNHVDFALSTGIRVPDTVRLYSVPDTIVDIFPQYRGFEYIVVRHDLVIVDPETLEIVAVLPV